MKSLAYHFHMKTKVFKVALVYLYILCFKMLGLAFSSKLDWGSSIISIAKTASKKIGDLICSMKFLSPKVALYLYKSTIQTCMKYCCHVWGFAPGGYLELLDKLQKHMQDCRSFLFCHCWNIGSLLKCSKLWSLFYRYYFDRC